MQEHLAKIELLLKRKLFLKEKTLERKNRHFFSLTFLSAPCGKVNVSCCLPLCFRTGHGFQNPSSPAGNSNNDSNLPEYLVTVEKNVCVKQMSESVTLASQFSIEKKMKEIS